MYIIAQGGGSAFFESIKDALGGLRRGPLIKEVLSLLSISLSLSLSLSLPLPLPH